MARRGPVLSGGVWLGEVRHGPVRQGYALIIISEVRLGGVGHGAAR